MYLDANSVEELVDACSKLSRGENDLVMILLCRAQEEWIPDLCAQLGARGVRFFGGVFPAVIDGEKARDSGAILQRHSAVTDFAIAQLDGETVEWVGGAPQHAIGASKQSMIVLADFSCVLVTSLLEDLFDEFGDTVNMFGAGAGNGKRYPCPILFSSKGVHTGSAIVAQLNSPAVIGLRHGWSRNSEPIVATKTDGNVVEEINWRPAEEVYRELVGDEVADSLVQGGGVPQAKRFPFGIAREDLEDVVRDPLSVREDGAMLVLSGVPEHSLLHVLHGEDDRLKATATELGRELGEEEMESERTCLLFDCFSRAMLFGEGFEAELTAFSQGLGESGAKVRIEGALALGEIASDGSRMPDFHNKSIAACMFADE